MIAATAAIAGEPVEPLCRRARTGQREAEYLQAHECARREGHAEETLAVTDQGRAEHRRGDGACALQGSGEADDEVGTREQEQVGREKVGGRNEPKPVCPNRPWASWVSVLRLRCAATSRASASRPGIVLRCFGPCVRSTRRLVVGSGPVRAHGVLTMPAAVRAGNRSRPSPSAFRRWSRYRDPVPALPAGSTNGASRRSSAPARRPPCPRPPHRKPMGRVP